MERPDTKTAETDASTARGGRPGSSDRPGLPLPPPPAGAKARKFLSDLGARPSEPLRPSPAALVGCSATDAARPVRAIMATIPWDGRARRTPGSKAREFLGGLIR